jgi:glycosyltransferase involved in cell wall biosynthesis
MNVLITQYPVTRSYLDGLTAVVGQPLRSIVVSTITARGYLEIFRAFRGIEADSIYLPVHDSSGWPLLPPLQVLSMLSPANRRFVVDPDRKITPFGFFEAARSMVRIALGGLHGAATLVWEWLRLRRLLRAGRLAPTKSRGNRVAYLKTNLWLGIQAGGSVAHTTGVVKGLLNRGREVDFFSVESPVALPAHEALNLKPIKPRSTYVVPRELNHYRHNQPFITQVSPLLRELGGFIYQRLSLGNYAGVVLSRRHRLPLVIEYNGSERWLANNWGTPLSMEWLAMMAEDVCLRHAHLIVTVSEALKDELIRRGVEPERIVAHPNGVDTAVFSPDRFSRTDTLALRKRYGIPADSVVVTFVGTFGPWHGAEVLAKCVARMTETDSPGLEARKLHFMFIGDGVRGPLVESLTAAPEIRRYVTIAGLIDQEETPLHLAASDILVSPHVPNPDGSRFFGSPTKLFEYLAAGRPVIGSDIGQIADVLEGCPHVELLGSDGADQTGDAVGILVKPEDLTQLRAAINFLAENPKWRRVAGQNARQRALQHYTWDHLVAAILDGVDRVRAIDALAQKPVRILFNGLHSKSGGGLTYLRNMLAFFVADRDTDVHLCIHRDQREDLPDDTNGITIHYLDFPKGFWRLQLAEQIEVPKLARRIGANATFSPANYGPLAAPNSVILLRNALSVAFVERRPLKLAYWALVYIGTFLSMVVAKRVITVSEYARSAASGGLIGLFADRMTVVPHGISGVFSPPRKGAKREQFLLAVADIYVQKNLKNLIRAVGRLTARHPDVILKIAGRPVDVDYFAELKQIVAEEGLGDKIEFLGGVSPDILAELYRRCGVFVFPSTVETFGNPLVEAMASGAPIASSDTAAMPEVVGDAAIFFDPGDVDGMASAIDCLMNDDSLRHDLGRKAVERAKAFSWTKTAKSTLAIIKEAAAFR